MKRIGKGLLLIGAFALWFGWLGWVVEHCHEGVNDDPQAWEQVIGK